MALMAAAAAARMDDHDEYAKLVRGMNPPRVVIDNDASDDATVIRVDSVNSHGTLLAVVQVIADLNLVIRKAYFSSDGNWFMDVFNVTDRDGNKVVDAPTISYIQKTLEADDWYYPEARNTVGIVPTEEYTSIELTGTDRPGLLSEVCAVLAVVGCAVQSAELRTHNTRVAVVVHVTDAESGGAIQDAGRIADISARLGNLLRGQSYVRAGGGSGSLAQHKERPLHQNDQGGHAGPDADTDADAAGPARTVVSVTACAERGYTAVAVRCRDRPKLLFDTVGAITDMEYVVHHGTACAEPDGDAYQEYYIRHVDGHAVRCEAERQRLVRCLEAAIERRTAEGLELEVRAGDRAGLLSDITGIFRENGLAIRRAEISSSGGEAVDTFHLSDPQGHHVEAKTMEAIRAQVGEATRRERCGGRDSAVANASLVVKRVTLESNQRTYLIKKKSKDIGSASIGRSLSADRHSGMEATGRDGRRGHWRLGTSSGSSTTGTVSSGYTSTSSRLSWIFMEAARKIEEMEMKDLEFDQSPKKSASEKKMKQIKILAKQFFGAPSSAKCSIEGANLCVLERWFTELGIEWVLQLGDGAPAGELKHALDASSWILALTKIVDTFRLTSGVLPSHGSAEEEESATESEEQNMVEQLQLASFTQQAMSKMLTFVDFIVAPNFTCEVVFIANGVPVPAPYDKLHTLIDVCQTLSNALSKIRLLFYSSSSAEVARIHDEIVNILTAKEGKVRTAIWIALMEIRTRILESPEDGQGSSDAQTPQGSSGIDKTTASVMMYLMFLHHNFWSVESIVSEAASLGKYVPQVGGLPPLTSLAVDMVSCLEKKLVNKSEAFPDQALRFLFLLNNSSFIADQLHYAPNFPESYKVNLIAEVEGYVERYIQVSCAPMLSCLINPTPSCFGKNYTPLPKFVSEFQKMYTTQKLWKVPDPKLRSRLRRAIIDKVIPGYTRYLADYYGNAPLKFSPSYLQEMLQELFEG